LQSRPGFHGVRALWGTGGGEERVQPAQTRAGLASSAAGGVRRSGLHAARRVAQREHALRQRGGGISEGSVGETGKPELDSGGACRLRVLRTRVIAIPGGSGAALQRGGPPDEVAEAGGGAGANVAGPRRDLRGGRIPVEAVGGGWGAALG